MTNLEKASIEYANKEVLQPFGLPNETLKRYAINDFTAGAEWYKSQSKEVVKVLQSIIEWGAIKDGRFTYISSEGRINEIKSLIENLTKQ